MSTSDSPSCQLMPDMPAQCRRCQSALCLRQQVLNLALGEDSELLCLNCLAQDNDSEPQKLLKDVGAYVRGRECFAKEWDKYRDCGFCPSPATCYPDICFVGQEKQGA